MRKNEREKFPIYVLFIAAAHTHVCISRAFESVFRQILIKCFTPLVHNKCDLIVCNASRGGRKKCNKNAVVYLASVDRHPGNYFSYYQRRCIFFAAMWQEVETRKIFLCANFSLSQLLIIKMTN